MTEKTATPAVDVTGDRNAKYMVLAYDIASAFGGDTTRTRVYLLNAGSVFSGFGSRQGLRVTGHGSLIIRQTDPWGMKDTEYDIADPAAWGTINAGLKLAAAQGTLWHVGMVHE